MKKWRLDRVQTVLENRIQKLQSEKTEIRAKAELVENAYSTRFKPFLTGASIAAPIILGLYSVESLKNYVLFVLAIDIAFGVIMFWLHNSILRKIHNHILSVDDAFLSAIKKLNYFRDYFSMDTYFLDKISEDKIASYYNYHTFASLAAQVELIQSLESMINSRYFDKMKDDLQIRLRDKKEAMEYGMEVYRKQKPLWDIHGIDWKGLRYVHEDFFIYHGYNIEPETGEITPMTEKDRDNKETKGK